MENQQYLTIHALTKYIKRKFDADPHLQHVFVRGEISNFKRHSSGHMYFTLKDDRARILAVMFSSANQQMKFKPENGMNVLIKAEVSVYESGGQYQLYVKSMEPDGVGALYLAYEQLKNKLENEGLFQSVHKRDLPRYPKGIGVITSPTGAAVRDIITTIHRRYPIAKIVVYPALVQGDQAKRSIVQSIEAANENEELDVIILGRGGGSIEELWAFNEEAVARAIFSSELPIISAVGHETDFTIADFVADLRAPTPTGAAELSVPSLEDLLERILQYQVRLMRAMNEKTSSSKKKLDQLQHSYLMRNPYRILEQQIERLDRLVDKLTKEQVRNIKNKINNWKMLEQRLIRNNPKKQWVDAQSRLFNSQKSLHSLMKNKASEKTRDFLKVISNLNALSPLKVMERGYSVVYSEDGQLLKSIKDTNIGNTIEINMKDGLISCEVKQVKEKKNE
jgi:exodeoxyribonuclease VII large subunit